MAKVLLQCALDSDARYLKDLFEKSGIDLRLQVQTTRSAASSKSFLAHESVSLFVMVAPEITERDLRFLSEVKSKYYERGLMVLTEALRAQDPNLSKNRQGIHILEKPFSKEDVLGLAERLVKDPFSKQQKFKRFRTRQTSHIESLTTGRKSPSTMLNLSMGGAFFETDNVDFYNVNDLLRLRVSLADLSREHNLIGKVVWRTIQHQKSGRAGVGVEFVRKGELYQHLMRKMRSQNPAMAHILD
jgi:Tfp pilus assembly protein PilZ